MTASHDAAVYYVDTLKWCLVPIPHGNKKPVHNEWNKVENTIRTLEDAKYWEEHPNDNMGVLLDASGLAILDIDDIEDTKLLFSSFGIDYDKILDGAPRIKGRPGHDKAVFRAPPDISLKPKKLAWENKDEPGKTHTVFEFRGGDVQDVLPPSIHPDTKQPYEWVVDPTNGIPPVPKEFLTMWLEWDKFRSQLQNACPWATKKALPPLPKKEKQTAQEEDVIGKYNETVRVTDILENHGYKKISSERYLSPFSTTGLPGVIVFPRENRIFSHHGSEPFDSSKSHDAFDLFKFFDCGDDMVRALKEAAQKLGIKTKFEKQIEHGKSVTETFLKGPELNMEAMIKEAQERNTLPLFPTLDPGMFKDYLEFGKRVSYSLEEFHFAALLSVASMAIGRKAVSRVGMIDLHPNVFVMVVGQTTISGKSVACNIAVDNFGKSIIFEEPIAKAQSTKILRGTISEARLIQELCDVYNNLWYFDDCAGFFDDITTWNAHILGTMCSIYDGSPQERKLSNPKKTKKDAAPVDNTWTCPTPFMSILFNTTTKDIEQIANSKLFSSGFFPRIMWFYGQGGQPRKNEDVGEEDKRILAGINHRIKALRLQMAKLQDDSIVFGVCHPIEDWKMKATMNRLGKEDEEYRTAISRGFIHAYKIATILTIFDPVFMGSVGTTFPVKAAIPEKHALMAIAIVEKYLMPRMMFVHELCNNTDNKNHQVIVIKALNHFGGTAERTKVLRRTHLGKKEMDLAITTLIESGEVKMYQVKKPGNDKATTILIKQ
jgi:hypothetical protein